MRVDGEPAVRREPEESPIAIGAREHSVPNLELVGLRLRVQLVVFIGIVGPPFRVAVRKACARTRGCVGSRISRSVKEARQVDCFAIALPPGFVGASVLPTVAGLEIALDCPRAEESN